MIPSLLDGPVAATTSDGSADHPEAMALPGDAASLFASLLAGIKAPLAAVGQADGTGEAAGAVVVLPGQRPAVLVEGIPEESAGPGRWAGTQPGPWTGGGHAGYAAVAVPATPLSATTQGAADPAEATVGAQLRPGSPESFPEAVAVVMGSQARRFSGTAPEAAGLAEQPAPTAGMTHREQTLPVIGGAGQPGAMAQAAATAAGQPPARTTANPAAQPVVEQAPSGRAPQAPVFRTDASPAPVIVTASTIGPPPATTSVLTATHAPLAATPPAPAFAALDTVRLTATAPAVRQVNGAAPEASATATGQPGATVPTLGDGRLPVSPSSGPVAGSVSGEPVVAAEAVTTEATTAAHVANTKEPAVSTARTSADPAVAASGTTPVDSAPALHAVPDHAAANAHHAVAATPVITGGNPAVGAERLQAAAVDLVAKPSLEASAGDGAGSRRIQAQVTRAILAGSGLNSGEQTLTLQLEPDHLGKVEVRLLARGDRLEITFTADTPEAQQALREGSNDLVRLLAGRVDGRWQHVDIKVADPTDPRRENAQQDQRDQDRPRDGRRESDQQERRRERRQNQ